MISAQLHVDAHVSFLVFILVVFIFVVGSMVCQHICKHSLVSFCALSVSHSHSRTINPTRLLAHSLRGAVHEIVRTPRMLNFPELHNFMAELSLDRNLEFYFWAHADNYVLPLSEGRDLGVRQHDSTLTLFVVLDAYSRELTPTATSLH